MIEFGRWDSFWVIVDTAAGALIGLQFVVVTLIAEMPALRDAEGAAAFGAPTIVHFSAALFLAAQQRIPWTGIATPAVIWGLVGVAGVIYMVVVARRLRRQSVYRPQFEDWLFHVALPLAAYGLLVAWAFPAAAHPRPALFGVGAAALILLFVGIHNAWDSIAYHVFVRRERGEPKGG